MNTIFVLMYALVFWLYFAVNLQWYSYKLNRVIFKTSKPKWHIYFFVVPFLILSILCTLKATLAEWIILFTINAATFILWYIKLDKKLVFTPRVKRFLLAYLAILLPPLFLFPIGLSSATVLFSLLFAHYVSSSIEQKLGLIYENQAITKLNADPNRVVIAITASYGKTSMKNILAALLATKYKVYATPKSVNTKKGIMKDINEHLPNDADIYIVEAGAREKGDIAEITQLVKPHYAIIGKIGTAHLEYFKTLENTKKTKREILESNRLQKAFIYENASDSNDEHIFKDSDAREIKADLSGTSFIYKDNLYACPLLGAFNALNIIPTINIAKELGVSDEQISITLAKLAQVEHRLQKIEAGGKLIIDDGFNGNIDGISEGIRLCSTHSGRKVIVTPGIIEVSDDVNEKLALLINDTFDLVIITGEQNAKLLDKLIVKPKKIILKDKTLLTETLATQTYAGDVIYFANDAPNFI